MSLGGHAERRLVPVLLAEAPLEADPGPGRDPDATRAAFRARLDAFAAACAAAGGRPVPVDARAAAAWFHHPLDALAAALAARDAVDRRAGEPDFGIALALVFGDLPTSPDPAAPFSRLERPAPGAPGELRATAAVVESLRGAAPVGFAYLGPTRGTGFGPSPPTYRVLDGLAGATAAAVRRRPPEAHRGGPEDPRRPVVLAPRFRREGPRPTPPWLAEALASETGDRLARSRAIDLLAPGAAERAAGTGADALEAAARLGADFALDGRVRAEPGRVSAALRLLDARTGRVLWAGWREADRKSVV